jgi:hypothetical protein
MLAVAGPMPRAAQDIEQRKDLREIPVVMRGSAL